MVGKTKPIRPHDALRMDTIARHCGCLPCLIAGISDVHTTIEHATEHGRRVGDEEQHQWTIGLCRWHHFGEMTGTAVASHLGPSLAWGRKEFEDWFGDELEVLVPTQDFMLDLFDRQPWPEYALPRHVAKEVRTFWQTKYARPSQFIVQS